MRPLVSIIIPVYNRTELVLETLDSVVSQIYLNWECIIIDDGSIDNSEAKIKAYIKNDQRFHFYRHSENKGASSCRNIGLKKARGELIQFLDSDDLLGSSKLEEQVKLFDPNRLDVLTCRWGWFEKKEQLYLRFKHKYYSYRNFRKGTSLLNNFGKFGEFFPPVVYLTPLALIEKSGLWNENLTNNDDAEFFTRILVGSSGVRFTPDAEAFYRVSNKDKLSLLDTKDKVKSAIKSWELIEVHIKNVSLTRSAYVRRAKFDLYNSLKKSFPELLKSKKQFFMDKKKYSLSFHLILYSKVLSILKLKE